MTRGLEGEGIAGTGVGAQSAEAGRFPGASWFGIWEVALGRSASQGYNRASGRATNDWSQGGQFEFGGGGPAVAGEAGMSGRRWEAGPPFVSCPAWRCSALFAWATVSI